MFHGPLFHAAIASPCDGKFGPFGSPGRFYDGTQWKKVWATIQMLVQPIGGRVSPKEITRMVFANLQYRPKEREVHFQNRWDRLSIPFLFTESKCAQFYSQERKLSSTFSRTAKIAVMF
jgi:hypothetical protein